MSYAIDVDILVYASDAESPMHDRASAFLRQCVSGREIFCLAWMTLLSYLRMGTHPAIFHRPLMHQQAAHFVEVLLAVPNRRVLGEAEGSWDWYREVTRGVSTRRNLVPDAPLASLLNRHAVVTPYTDDRDFRKFDFLEVRDPLG